MQTVQVSTGIHLILFSMSRFTILNSNTGRIDRALQTARSSRYQCKTKRDTKGVEYWTDYIQCLLLVRDLRKVGVIAIEIESTTPY